MKKILYLWMLLLSISIQAQTELTDLEVCDIGNDGYGAIDLTVKIPEILDGEEWSDYTINFYETYSNAQDNQYPIMNPESYYNITPSIFTLYVRKESWEGDVTLYSFQVVFLAVPEIGQPVSLINPNGIFNLTDNSAIISNSNPDYVLSFHLSIGYAEQGTFAIANPLNYVALSLPQTIYVRVENSNGCYVITNFNLLASNDAIVYIPDLYFKNKLLQANTTTTIIARDINGNSMVIDANGDGEIQYTEAASVYQLQVVNTSIQDLTGIEAFVNLTVLHCFSNNLTTLDFSNNVNLTLLRCESNALTELNLSNNINLNFLNCNNNNLTELDLSNNSNLETLWAIFNPQLSYLNINNGGNLNPEAVDSGSWMEMWANLPDNIYICADDSEIALIQPYLNMWDNTGQVISSYCTFYPQGNYNTITGIVSFDLNNDGVCDDNVLQSFIKINITDGVDQNNSFTSEDGTYIFFTQEGEYILSADVENPSFFNVTPITETVSFPDNNNNEEIVNFCISPNGIHNDLEVVIAPINPARPGFEATYKIVYRNKGNQIMSDGLNFVFNQNLMTFVSASVEPDSQGSGSLNWIYENLMPFESRSIIVTMQINPPTHPTYPVNIDDVLTFTSLISPSDGDENTEDNLYVLNQTVVGSYDPNDITCIEGNVLDPDYIGEELHYLIRFENTGTFYAENIVVAMEIDEELYDISSLRVLDASHDVRAQVRGNMAEFFFNQIMLDSGGHGNILLVMKSMTALEEGDAVQSKADIYFDYNYPIITNDAVTIFEATMSTDENIKNIDLKVYPNPTTDYFNLVSESKIQLIELYDISGRLIKTSLINDFETKQDITNLNKGTYILKIKTENGEVTGKIIKN
jgi:formylmethanofuran dehydrogenase subunit D